MTKHPLLLGSHMSIAGGIENAYYKGVSIGCTAIQFFTHSNRQWAMKPISQESILEVKKAQKETGIAHTVVHASYLINLASTTKETRKKSKNMILMELEACEDLGITYLILHPGSNPDQEEGISLLIEGLNEIFEESSTKTKILLETMAGQGSQLGYRFEQLAAIKEGISSKRRIAYCIDTCHLWAAGYDISNKKSYNEVWKEFDAILGLEHLKAIHLNDSKKEYGSRVDRHAEIGEGTIGLEAFRLIMNDPRFSTIPKVLETPGKELSDYERNLKLLKKLYKS